MEKEKHPKSGRAKKLTLFVTIEELNTIRQNAKDNGLSVASYVRTRAIDKK